MVDIGEVEERGGEKNDGGDVVRAYLSFCSPLANIYPIRQAGRGIDIGSVDRWAARSLNFRALSTQTKVHDNLRNAQRIQQTVPDLIQMYSAFRRGSIRKE